MKLSVVIPVYNERATLAELVAAVESAPLPPEIDSLEIILVDDGSTDGTRELLASFLGRHRVIFHKHNQGKGAALRTGFAASSGDIVLVQDADLEYDPAEYPKLLRPILDDRADVVYGSRFMGGEPHRILYFWHMLANQFLTLGSNMLSDLNLSDMETCYKVFRGELIRRIPIEENRFGFEPEITAKIAHRARHEGVRVYEVGISYYGRTYEEGKKIGWKDALRAFWCILKYNTTALARVFRYGLMGLLVMASQYTTIVALVEGLQMRSIAGQNIANAISIEVSILVGFLLHSGLTWRYRFLSAGDALSRLALFHGVTALSFFGRLGLFYVLSLTGMHYQLNVAIGIALSVVLNFIGYDRVVYRKMFTFGASPGDAIETETATVRAKAS